MGARTTEDATPGPGEVASGAPGPVWRLPPLLAAIGGFAGAHYLAMIRLVRGDLLNSYPFISTDGFDWLVEGFAVARWLDGVSIPALPAARGPGFVSVVFADYHLGADGLVLFAVMALAVFVSLAALATLAAWVRAPRYQAATVVLVFALSPLGFTRVWILSDQLATALTVVGAVALYPALTRAHRGWLMLAAGSAVLAGITQLYGLIPFLVVGGWWFSVTLWRRRPDLPVAAALVAVPLATAILGGIWREGVPHTGVPPQLGLIEFSFEMAGFYANVWSFAFLPLVPLLIVLAIHRRDEIMASPVLAGYWLAVAALLVSTFFYQFEDSRFTVPTSFMLGVAVTASLPGARPLPGGRPLMGTMAALAILVGLVLTPAGYWKPKWSEMSLDPADGYVARLLTAEPVDRFALAGNCPALRLCGDIPLPPGLSDHNRARLGIYRFLVTADATTSLDTYYWAEHQGIFDERNTNDCCLADTTFRFGTGGDRPVVGDWDGLPDTPGGGTDTPGVFRDGVWGLRNTNAPGAADFEFRFGEPGDHPVAGDWDGDGVDTVGVFRAGRWLLRDSNTAGSPAVDFAFGQAGDVPVVGDWDGDGVDTVGVFRSGRWLLRDSNTAGPPQVTFDFGGDYDRPVSGDWDGDGRDTIGTFTEGLWRLRNRLDGGRPDLEFYFGAYGHIPITGDWDGAGGDSVGVSR